MASIVYVPDVNVPVVVQPLPDADGAVDEFVIWNPVTPTPSLADHEITL